MKMLRPFAAALLLACSIAVPAQAQPKAPQQPQPVTAKDITVAVMAGRYDEVEALYAQLMRDRSRSGDGSFMFETFVWASPVYSSDNPKEFDHWPKVDALTAAWVAHSPKSIPAAITRARALVRRVEHLEATHGSWKDIEVLTRQAGRALEAVQAAGKRDVNWHAIRIRLAHLQGLPKAEVQELVREAAAVDPLPVSLWQEAAIGMQGQKCESANLRWLMNLAVERTARTEGKSMYARILFATSFLYCDVRSDPFGRGGLDWRTLSESIMQLKERYPSQYEPNEYGALACLAGDKRTTAKALQEASTMARKDSVWEEWGGPPHYERCKAWAFDQRPGAGKT